MKKRTSAMFLATVLTMGTLLGGCSSQEKTPETTPPTETTPPAGTTAPAPTPVDFPTTHVNFVVGFAAGHSSDISARMIGSVTEPFLGESIVIVNQDGAGGALALQSVAKADPDGYTLSYLSDSLNVAYYQGNMETTYKDYVPVCQTSAEDMFIHVNGSAEWNTFEEFVEYAKAHPGEVTIGNGGIGTFTQLTAAAIEAAVGAEFQHVPLSGSDLYMAPINGQVDAICTSLFNALPYIQDGRLKTLVSTGEAESPYLDNPPPTMTSLGYDTVMQMYRGVGAPAGTPDEVVAILEEAFRQGIESDDFQEFCATNAIGIDFKGAKEFQEYIVEKDKIIADLMGKTAI